MTFNIKILFEQIMHYLFAIAIVLSSQSIWITIKGLDSIMNIIVMLLGGSFLGCLFLGKTRRNDFIKSLTLSGLIFVYMFFFWYIDSYRTNSFIRQMMIMILCALYCSVFQHNNKINWGKQLNREQFPFWNCYENLIIIIACVSLIFWVFGSLLGLINHTGYVYTSWTGVENYYKRIPSYYGLYFETQSGVSSLLGVNYRNSAIFTEAPMAGIHFFVALLIELFMKKEQSKSKLIILIIAIISTVSTASYLGLLLAFFIKFILKKENKGALIILKYTIMTIGIVVGFYVMQYLIETKLGTDSGSIRVDDFIAGYKAWMDHPILGNGYGNFNSIKNYMSSFRNYNMGFSNSLVYILAIGGIYLFMPYLMAAIIGISKMIKYKVWDELAFYILFLITFAIMLIPFIGLTYMVFIMMGCNSYQNQEIQT